MTAHQDGKPWFHNVCDTRCYGECKASYEFGEPNHRKIKKCKGWRCDGTGLAHDDGQIGTTCACGKHKSARNKNGIWVWPKGHSNYAGRECRKGAA